MAWDGCGMIMGVRLIERVCHLVGVTQGGWVGVDMIRLFLCRSYL